MWESTPEVYEVRYSVGLKTTWKLDFPVFTLVTMADSVTTTSDPKDFEQLGNRREWETAGLLPSVQATGVAAFAFRIRSLLPQWQAEWSKLLDEIGKALKNDVSQGRLF